MRRIAISGLVALAAALGGVALPATAMAQPTAAVRPATAAQPATAVRAATAARADSAAVMRTATTALSSGAGALVAGEPQISCVLSTDCLGVDGSSSLTSGQSTPTRVARWNGSTWKGVGVALPKGTKSVDLDGVSCKGSKFCLVVGDYYTSTSQSASNHAFALSYNGTSLKPTPAVPLPKGTADAALSGVSCVTATDCVALGMADGDSTAFGENGSLNIVETWNGAKWTLHPVAAGIGKTTYLQLSTVSCATSAFCVLAGETTSVTSTSATVKVYAASWNGKNLTTMKPVTVGGSAGTSLVTGASCATASNCAVTGVDLAGTTSTSTVTAFTEIWNGKAWQLAKVAWPKGTASSFTMGVSCYAAHTCEAVGVDSASDLGTSSAVDAAAVSFKGTTGTLQAVPAPPKGDANEFTAVSCLPWGSCVATGGTGKTTATSPALMTGVWNGKAWKLAPGF